MSHEQPKKHRSFGLPFALGLSVVLHLLLLLLSFVVPVGPQLASVKVPADESLIRFTFAPPTEEDVEGRLEGDLPLPQHDAPPVEPDPLPEGTPSLEPPSSAAPPLPLEPRESEREFSGEPREDAGSLERLRRESEPAAPEPFPESEAGSVARLPEPRQGVEAGPGLGQRLEEFGRALGRARAERPRSESGGASRNVFIPDVTVTPRTGFGVGNLVFESRDYDWNDYARQIYMAIWRAWHNRLYQTADDFEKWSYQSGQWYLAHWTQVRFIIQRSGQVEGIVVETPSGCVPLDDSAADALAEVILPPLPADFPRDREVVHARFIAEGEIRGMRPFLRRMKMAGWF